MSKRIAAIKDRLTKITQGVWKLVPYKTAECVSADDKIILTFMKKEDPDAQFIAHAPQDMKHLLHEVERLQNEVRNAYSKGYAMAKFDCAMTLETGEYTKEELVEKWASVGKNNKKKNSSN